MPVMKRSDRMRDLRQKIPVHETFRIAALLAVVGGFLDAYTYLLRGGVFANAQTGNIVLLGVSLAEGDIVGAGYYVVPVFAFALGVFLTEMLKKPFVKHYIILIEFFLLTVIGFIPVEAPDAIVNVTVSFVCSLQVNSFRKVKELPFATTMCTGNLRSGTEKLSQYLCGRQEGAGMEAAHYFGIIGLFILGAAAGAVFSGAFGEKSIWLCSSLLMFVFILMKKE